MALTLRTVKTDTGKPILYNDGTVAALVPIVFRLVTAGGGTPNVIDLVDGNEILDKRITAITDANGHFSVALWPTARADAVCYYAVLINGITFKAPLPDEVGDMIWGDFVAGRNLTEDYDFIITANASDLTVGTLDGNRLPGLSTTKRGGVPATGTPTGKYLKDNGTWAASGAPDLAAMGALIGTATSKTPPVDDDMIGLMDSANSNILKKLSWTNIKATLKATGAEIVTGTDDAKFATAKALIDAGNVLAATVQTLTNKSIYLPDGEGLNYTLVPSIASGNLTVALKTFAGTNPSATDVSIFSIGAAMLNVADVLSVDVTAALGDIFSWDAGKIQGNDAQLFVYLINNNGTPQIGVSPCPTHLTVATNYYSNGSQTGAAGHTNMVMSGTRNATNSCRVIGRINVNQLDNNNWQAPTTALVINRGIYETDWLTWTPTYTGFSTPPTSFLTLYKLERETVSLITREYPAGTSDSTSFTKTAPILAKNITNMAWVGWLYTTYDNSSVISPPGEIAINFNTQVLYLSKVPGNAASWTASGDKRAQIMNFIYQV